MKLIVLRMDRGALQKPVEMPNGWLKVDGNIGRTGILEYARADGSTWREYRPPEEAFHPDALSSFALVPLTNEHPPEGKLTVENTRFYQVGTVEQPTRDGEHMRSSILITDAQAIADLKAGKRELSCGYMAEVETTPGEINGQRYDAIQRNVRGNHVALVKEGRAGASVCVRVDSAAADVVLSDSSQIGDADSHGKDNSNMIKIKIHGVEYEVASQVAQAIQSERTDAGQALDVARAETKAALSSVEKVTARADAADSKVTKLEADLKTAPAKALEAMKARAQIEAEASKRGLKFDGKSDVEIMREVAEKVTGLKLDGKSETYVQASYDLAITSEPEAVTAPIEGAERTDEKREKNSAELAAEMRKRSREAFKAGLPK